MNHLMLSKAIEHSSVNGETEESRNAILSCLKSIIKEDSWVWIPVQGNGVQMGLCTVDMHNGIWFVMFSDEKHIRTGENISILSTGISKLLEPLFKSSEVAGIAINPFTKEHAFIPRQVFISLQDEIEFDGGVEFVKNAVGQIVTNSGLEVFDNQEKACNMVADVFLDKTKLKNVAKVVVRTNSPMRLLNALGEGEVQGVAMVNSIANYLTDEMGVEPRSARIILAGFYLAIEDYIRSSGNEYSN